MSPTSLLWAIATTIILLLGVGIATCNKVDELEAAANNCSYFYETTVWWRDSPTAYTKTREFSYTNYDLALQKAVGEFDYWLSANETTEGLLDSFNVTLYSDCSYGSQVLYSDTFRCSDEPEN
jgi:hypothetical protein